MLLVPLPFAVLLLLICSLSFFSLSWCRSWLGFSFLALFAQKRLMVLILRSWRRFVSPVCLGGGARTRANRRFTKLVGAHINMRRCWDTTCIQLCRLKCVVSLSPTSVSKATIHGLQGDACCCTQASASRPRSLPYPGRCIDNCILIKERGIQLIPTTSDTFPEAAFVFLLCHEFTLLHRLFPSQPVTTAAAVPTKQPLVPSLHCFNYGQEYRKSCPLAIIVPA